MKLIRTEEAVGHVLCHDITQIIKGVTKDAVFRKGHVVTEEDIPVLLSVGKDTLYVWEKQEGILHEDEAAEILCSLCINENMSRTEAKEGKIELKAEVDGLLKVNSKGMKAVNSFGQMMIASRHGDFPVKKGDKLAGTRIIPLVIEDEKMQKAKAACLEATEGKPIFELKPFKHKKVGIVTTGNEVFYGRIKDTFTPVIEGKFAEFDSEVIAHEVFADNDSQVTDCILRMIDMGADIVVCTGGMSVDPDDKTPLAIRNTGARVVSYGAPVLPGAMFMLAYYEGAKENGKTCGTAPEEGGSTVSKEEINILENGGRTVPEDARRVVPIMGLPGCVMYAKRTIFDLVLPRIMSDDEVTADDLAELGEGGLCLNCEICTYPNCGFGK